MSVYQKNGSWSARVRRVKDTLGKLKHSKSYHLDFYTFLMLNLPRTSFTRLPTECDFETRSLWSWEDDTSWGRGRHSHSKWMRSNSSNRAQAAQQLLYRRNNFYQNTTIFHEACNLIICYFKVKL